jgi:hypothetical protein
MQKKPLKFEYKETRGPNGILKYNHTYTNTV